MWVGMHSCCDVTLRKATGVVCSVQYLYKILACCWGVQNDPVTYVLFYDDYLIQATIPPVITTI